MQIIEAFTTKNKCYQAATPLTPQGMMPASATIQNPRIHYYISGKYK